MCKYKLRIKKSIIIDYLTFIYNIKGKEIIALLLANSVMHTNFLLEATISYAK